MRDRTAGVCHTRRRWLQLAGCVPLLAFSPSRAARATGVDVYADPGLARYGFGGRHPFGVDRQAAFLRAAEAHDLLDDVMRPPGRAATRAELERFHTPAFVASVRSAEADGVAALDQGDTPVFPDLYPISAYVVGTALAGLERIMRGVSRRSLQPIGGLHHARRDRAAGFCVFNDCGVVIETLRAVHGVRRVAYVDIDAHHGDGIYYPFEADPDLIFADLHQASRTLFPGTGRADEIGTGAARGTKLNIEMDPGSGDADFMRAWERVEAHLRRFTPEFIVFQCGADSVQGDPLAQLAYSPAAHAHAALRLCAIADEFAGGRLMAFGGGGYDRDNIGQAWSGVLRALLS